MSQSEDQIPTYSSKGSEPLIGGQKPDQGSTSLEPKCESLISDRPKITRASEIAATPRAGDWGPWRLDGRTCVLYPDEPYRYEVDLETCTSSAEVLDWICQIAGKTWADDATLAGLVRALDDVLRPQATLCPSGQSKQLTAAAIRARVKEMGKRAV